jgi:septum formation inhibitor-activating ATPase MinD
LAQVLQTIKARTKNENGRTEDLMEKRMEKKHVVDKRSIKLEDVLKADYIPFLSGRPERETVIGKEDLMNLEIVLNTTKTVEEFITKI